MKLIKFLLQKIIIIEIMLIVLYFACSLFSVDMGIINTIINTSLIYLTPISIVALVLYIIVGILSSKIVETIISIVVGGLILYYLVNYII